jgi:histone acetyltransferase (RNA polymerase elongator complex component)
MKGERGIIPIFIPHMGCGHACIFCNQHTITGDAGQPSPESIHHEIESCLKTMRQPIKELAFYGGSFTGIDERLQIQYLEVAKAFQDAGAIGRIRVSTRPDYIDDAIIERLKNYGVSLVELGCQSFDDRVLSLSKRGHDSLAIDRAVSLLKTHGLAFGVQLMYGLPGDDDTRFLNSVDRAIALAPECVRIYPTLVIRGTELETLESYHAPTLEAATRASAEAVRRFSRAGIDIIRIGLQKTDLIDFDAEVKDGPLHPAFGAWVMSFLFFEALLPEFKRLNPNDRILIRVHPSQASYISGQERINITRFEAALGRGVRFKISADATVRRDEVWGVIDDKTAFHIHIMNPEV